MQRAVKRQLSDVNLILWAAWDPIGCGVPVDEYESYAPQILALLPARGSGRCGERRVSALATEGGSGWDLARAPIGTQL